MQRAGDITQLGSYLKVTRDGIHTHLKWTTKMRPVFCATKNATLFSHDTIPVGLQIYFCKESLLVASRGLAALRHLNKHVAMNRYESVRSKSRDIKRFHIRRQR